MALYIVERIHFVYSATSAGASDYLAKHNCSKQEYVRVYPNSASRGYVFGVWADTLRTPAHTGENVGLCWQANKGETVLKTCFLKNLPPKTIKTQHHEPPSWIVLGPVGKPQTFHDPNLIHWIKYIKSSAPESIRNACFNLEQHSRSSALAQPGISTSERLWFRRRPFHIPNLMHKLL